MQSDKLKYFKEKRFNTIQKVNLVVYLFRFFFKNNIDECVFLFFALFICDIFFFLLFLVFQ